MKRLCCLLAVLLLGGLAESAHAYAFKVLDPFPGVGTFTATSITGTAPFAITFGDGAGGSNCPANQGPDPGGQYDDDTYCFVGLNSTGGPLTNVEVTVPNNPGLDGVTCQTTGINNSPFLSSVCTDPSPSDDDYTMYFFSGAIPNGNIIILAETGLDPSDFTGAMASVNVTPEPASIWMLGSGMLLSGLLLFRRRIGWMGQ
ncbi:MAG TPA: PEP-CTERM sorting domain-containing protein [Acidobacteriaceae bacterium]|jgi:hypothetical protein|nr:PEP-CTERM sorting domain-containing protein [Acidobacteriaceae bacterium]